MTVLPTEAIPFAVVTWKQGNAGGESLVYRYAPGEPFTVVTGPTPWGAGCWGPFQPESILSVRRALITDSWPVSGCPSQRWDLRSVRDAFRRNDTGAFRDRRIDEIEAILTGGAR